MPSRSERAVRPTGIDLMDVDRTAQLRRAYRDPDGVDWRLEPRDDLVVLDALRPDAPDDAQAPDATGLSRGHGRLDPS